MKEVRKEPSSRSEANSSGAGVMLNNSGDNSSQFENISSWSEDNSSRSVDNSSHSEDNSSEAGDL